MGFSPIMVGDGSVIHNTFTTDSGVFPLTSVASDDLAMHFHNLSTGDDFYGEGTWTIINATAGVADYLPAPGDVATAGLYRVCPVVNLPTGPKAFDEQELEIRDITAP